ncbi:hypothetical protein [Catellatospora citrea]|uniref:Uncharacterized protein n=1 Tax=Catellatospora citrea TaxID=53366 RepID=A0A8J3NWY0_9ACTN|nr:hypothetical protein [Catellatospora citrea]RKE12929.1 hypothetical protein C8E86_7874 [Catellatospora citrea]GIF95830.1 hypothetical protein Cci01nite_09240 [Catellatospora citrea]
MVEQDQLERSYRRLLWAYPRFYRRERGLEILTTLLDAAKPGQVRATREDAAHLILSGLRFRLVPPGWAAKVAAGVATLWLATVLSGVGAYLAWGTSSADPRVLDDPKVAALADALVGRPPTLVSSEDSDLLVLTLNYRNRMFYNLGTEALPGLKPAPADHHREYEFATTRGVLDAAHRRLQADGWQTGVVTRPESGRDTFWATRDGLLLRMAEVRSTRGPSSATVDIYPVEPRGVPAGALAGFAVGLLLAWPVMTSLARRCPPVSHQDRLLVVLFGLPALLACFANTLYDVVTLMMRDQGSVLLAIDLVYPLANLVASPVAATMITVGLAGCVAVLVIVPWHRRRSRTDAASAHLAVVRS